MRLEPPLRELGQFVVMFQAVEATMVDLIIQLCDSDPEYVAALTAELEFTAKSRALDVIFSRFAQIHRLCDGSPHREFHSLMVRVKKLAERRNELVHSFYNTLITVDGQLGMMRLPTRLLPSKGLRQQEHEDILSPTLSADLQEMDNICSELWEYRRLVIATMTPD